jgi:large subunit ribosomal protein L4e
MKLSVFETSKNKTGEIDMPIQFNEDVREDLIKRAVLAIRSARRQPYGAAPRAGKRASVRLSKRRRDYRGTYGFGISRTPRKILSRRGRRMFWVGAFAPGTVGGRRAHPPKAGKGLVKSINRKERRKAIRSAISATVIRNIVEERGHIPPSDFPFVLDKKFESLNETKLVLSALKDFGLDKELSRVRKKTIRPGKGKSRGRKYRTKKGPLIVVSGECKLSKAASNIPGVEVVLVKALNAEILAPGAVPGRLTLWTQPTLEMLKKENLFE